MAISKFRPCIDLHAGKVKQIVGGSLGDKNSILKENFISEKSAASFAHLFKNNNLTGGHVIQLGPGNDLAAKEALNAWKGGLQIGGGIHLENAEQWLEHGASHVIVTSAIFDKDGYFQPQFLDKMMRTVGKERLVVDLSCKRVGEKWMVAMNKWQTITDLELSPETLTTLALYCDEFLIHAADVEGLCAGMDDELVSWLGAWSAKKNSIPVTYAGGISSLKHIELIQEKSNGRIDYTVGSALDLFGGAHLTLSALVKKNMNIIH